MHNSESCILDASGPVGVFDSGIGGLSIMRELIKQLPHEDIVYLADTVNMPYGPRDLREILELCAGITRFFISQKVKLIVIACNTASAAALHPLREMFPAMPFVGMEPAVKPAAENTRTGYTGVLATEGTFKGKPYSGVVERFAANVKIFEQPCPGLADMIENGVPEDEISRNLRNWIEPLKQSGVDQLALACTHYPLVLHLIENVCGDSIKVIDPSPAIARQTGRLLDDNSLRGHNKGELTFYTTNNVTGFSRRLCTVLGKSYMAKQIVWCDGEIDLCL